MSFLELARKRTSIRGYENTPVSQDELDTVLEAGRIAPSAANFQPWDFVVVKNPAVKEKLREAYGKEWFWKAPVIIVVCINPSKAWTRTDGKNYGTVDGAIAMDHMTLCAADIGLGTCWIGAFDPNKVKQVLELPSEIMPLAMTPLGKPASKPFPKKRKDIDEVVHWDKW